GRLIGRNRDDVTIPAALSAATIDSAREHIDRPAFIDVGVPLWSEHGAVLATRAGEVAFVGVFDRWVESRIKRALVQGLLGGFLFSVIIGHLATFLVARRVAGGLRRAEGVVHRMASGELGVRLPSWGDDEVGRLANDFNAMAESLERT